jgi:hypothetical protein
MLNLGSDCVALERPSKTLRYVVVTPVPRSQLVVMSEKTPDIVRDIAPQIQIH